MTMRKDEPPRVCACGASYRPTRPDQRFCSKSCAWKATKGPAFNARISRASATRRGDLQRGRGQQRGYVKRDGRHEHRVVAERAIGRPLTRGEIVHHIDGDPRNNDISNLRVMRQGDHMREHGLGIPGVAPHWKPWTAARKSK